MSHNSDETTIFKTDGKDRINMQMKFLTDSIGWEIKETKTSKDYYVEGYISTPDLDAGNDIVTVECLDDMVNQLKEGNIKIDVEHETWKGTPDIAVGKIIDANRDEKGIKVLVILNKHHHRFKEVWESVKNGFLDAFSIAYDVIDFDTEEMPNA